MLGLFGREHALMLPHCYPRGNGSRIQGCTELTGIKTVFLNSEVFVFCAAESGNQSQGLFPRKANADGRTMPGRDGLNGLASAKLNPISR